MTTLIYFFLMSLTLFVVPQIITKILNKEPSIDSNVVFLVLAAALPLIWIFVPKELIEVRSINFIQHSLGGGVAVGLVAIYFINSLKNNFSLLKNSFFQLLFFYALVSSLGVLNELLEFLLDFFGIGIFSADRYDTWYDMVANTTGSMFVFVMFKFRELLYKIFQ